MQVIVQDFDQWSVGTADSFSVLWSVGTADSFSCAVVSGDS